MSGKPKKKSGGSKATDCVADLESDTRYETILKNKVTSFNTPVSIHIHSTRKRLVDADSVSAKAAIDGLVNAGLLEDDSSEFVQEVSYSQEKGEPEETTITVREV